MRHSAPATPGAIPASSGHQIVNRIIPVLLRTPVLHRVLGRDLMLISFTGRTSGRRFTTPVTYTPTDRGVAFFSNNRWWTNLRGGAPVTLRLRGRDVAGWAKPAEDAETVVREVRAYLATNGAASARKIGLGTLPPRAHTDAELRQAARDHVVVFVTTDGSSPKACQTG